MPKTCNSLQLALSTVQISEMRDGGMEGMQDWTASMRMHDWTASMRMHDWTASMRMENWMNSMHHGHAHTRRQGFSTAYWASR
eukprot:244788-Chlamydomonas_euryale.AAC.1